MTFRFKRSDSAMVMLLTIITLTGCSSMPSGTRFSTIASQPEEQALVYFYRPEAYYGKAVAFPVSVNGNEIAQLGERGYFSVTMEPGDYTIQPDTSSIDKALKTTVQPGELYFLRLKVNRRPALCFCTSLEFELEKKEQALKELQQMRRESDRVYTDRVVEN